MTCIKQVKAELRVHQVPPLARALDVELETPTMTKIDQHPTVIRVRSQPARLSSASHRIAAQTLRKLCLDAGADDVGFVSIDRPTWTISGKKSSEHSPAPELS